MGEMSLHSYALATNKGRRLLHVQRDGEPSALCGARRVRFIGEVDTPLAEGWPYCPACVAVCEEMPDTEPGDWWWHDDAR